MEHSVSFSYFKLNSTLTSLTFHETFEIFRAILKDYMISDI